MRRIVCFVPGAIAAGCYVLLGALTGFGGIHPGVWGCVALLFASGLLMARGKWWGCFLGVAVGLVLVWMGTRYTGQIINETPVGVALCCIYGGLGLWSKKSE